MDPSYRLTLDQGTLQRPAQSKDFSRLRHNCRTGGSSSIVRTVRGDMSELLAFVALDRGFVAAQLPPGSRLGLLEARGNDTALIRMLLPSAPFGPLPFSSEGTSNVPHNFQRLGSLLLHLLHRGSHPLLEGLLPLGSDELIAQGVVNDSLVVPVLNVQGTTSFVQLVEA